MPTVLNFPVNLPHHCACVRTLNDLCKVFLGSSHPPALSHLMPTYIVSYSCNPQIAPSSSLRSHKSPSTCRIGVASFISSCPWFGILRLLPLETFQALDHVGLAIDPHLVVHPPNPSRRTLDTNIQSIPARTQLQLSCFSDHRAFAILPSPERSR